MAQRSAIYILLIVIIHIGRFTFTVYLSIYTKCLPIFIATTKNIRRIQYLLHIVIFYEIEEALF